MTIGRDGCKTSVFGHNRRIIVDIHRVNMVCLVCKLSNGRRFRDQLTATSGFTQCGDSP